MSRGIGPRHTAHSVGHDGEAVRVDQDLLQPLGESIVQSIIAFPFIKQLGSPCGHVHLCIFSLVVVGGMRIRQQ